MRPSVPRRQRSVWVVDDSPLDGSRAAGVLDGHYDVQVFEDGSAVLERLASDATPDVLVLDWVMPGISGIDVCRFLRSSARVASNSVGILLLTGHQRTEQIVEGLSAGANDFLSKPYAEEELRARVAALIRSKELLERAEEAERVVRLVLDSAPEALLVLDSSGRVSYLNAEAERVLQSKTPTVLGKKPADLIAGLVWSRTPRENATDFALPDVSIADQVFAPVVRSSTGETGSTTISLRNVTEQRQREERRLDLYAVVAHDLRSPLNAIHLRTEALLDGRRGPLSDEVSADLQKMRKNVGALVDLINDFLDLARLDSSAGGVERRPVDLALLLEGVIDGLNPLVEAAEHDLRVFLPGEPVNVLGDAPRLAQVLANLVTNAVKYTPRGGKLRASILAGPTHVEARIDDNGPGIDAALVPTLTQRYVRGGAGTVSTPSTGLGLMIVHQILEAHGAELGVDTELGRGSSFWFRLPRI
jgi:two-component system phosphate regulon sensor histidine kinase PhoR